MKRLFVLLTVLCLALGLCACGGTAEPPAWEADPETPAPSAPEPVAAEPEEPVEEDAAAPSDGSAIEPATDYADWWGGKWYGWAVFTQASGRFSDQQDNTWDVVAQIDVDGSEGSIQIFDITSLDEPELSANVRFAAGLTEHGKMICRYGSFIDIAYGSNTWSCDPGERAEGRLEHTIAFSFLYSDVENNTDSVLVSYILRPWGMRWEDVLEADTTGMLYDDMMPRHYEDWYLPQLD